MIRSVSVSIALATSLCATQGLAQQETPARGLSIELNAATASESGACTLSFVIENRMSTGIDSAVFETVLFDTDGQVDRLTLFDFGALPPGRPRVRQFTVPDTACDGIGRILFNGAHACETAEEDPTACVDGLELQSRTGIEVIG